MIDTHGNTHLNLIEDND